MRNPFQSTRSRRARPSTPHNPRLQYICFNPRAREERDLFAFDCYSMALWFQSTRSRRARPANIKAYAHIVSVSIHALAKSATYRRIERVRRNKVSIHALAKSATRQSKTLNPARLFQSTRSRRARQSEPRQRGHERNVSIHALAKSATIC